MASPPKTQYAKSGRSHIAYQVLGEGPLDLVYLHGWISHLELTWEQPAAARFFRRLSSFTRLILCDKRGTGLSDPVPIDQLPTLEQRMDRRPRGDGRRQLGASGPHGGLRRRADGAPLRRDLPHADGRADPAGELRAAVLGRRLSVGHADRGER